MGSETQTSLCLFFRVVLSSSSSSSCCCCFSASCVTHPPPRFKNSHGMPLIFCVASSEKRRCCGADRSVTQDSTAGGESGQTPGAGTVERGGVRCVSLSLTLSPPVSHLSFPDIWSLFSPGICWCRCTSCVSISFF